MAKKAQLTRMVISNSECPFGVKAVRLLEAAGYEIDERILRTRPEVEEYLAELGVSTTPQVFINGKLIGTSADLERFLEREKRDAAA